MSAEIGQKDTLCRPPVSVGYYGLRSPGFDFWLVFGAPAIALSSLLVLLIWPGSLYVVLALDLWLLGYHHVIATYTRIGMDAESRRKYWALMLLLPILVIAGVFSIGMAGGASLLTTIYFYWLWFHYVRQSEGVSKAYAASCDARTIADMALHRISFYLIPTVSLFQLSSNGSTMLLGVEIRTFALPPVIMASMWILAAIVAVTSLYRLYKMTQDNKVSKIYFAFLCLHYAMFILTYGLVHDLTTAWLALNIWHNLQYLTFVWLSHERRFKGAISPRAVVLSTLAQPKNIALYIAACLSITFAFYMGVEALLLPMGSALGTTTLLTAVMAYQAINFHHYIVDALIWRRPVRKTNSNSINNVAAS